MITNFNELPNELDFSVTYGTSRAKHYCGLPTKKLVQRGSTNVWRVTGCGYDAFGDMVGKMITTLFKPYLKEISPDILKEYYGIYLRENDLFIDGACGLSSMENILKDLLGYTIKYHYKLDRKGRPDYKIGFTLTKISLQSELYTMQQLIDRGDIVNLNLKYPNNPSVAEVWEKDNFDYYLKNYNPNGKFVADKAHSGLYHLRGM